MQSIDESEEMRYSYLRITQDRRNWMQKKEGIRKESREGRIRTILLLGILFVVCFLGSFLLGRYAVSPKELGGILLSRLISIEPFWSSAAERVVFNIRLPRVLSAALIGAGLSAAGLCYQGLFQNPMVSPDVLGASAGAGFGAALGILLGFSYFNISAFSFVCGLGAVLLVQLVASQVKSSPMIGLVLGGIMISSLFSSGISFIKLVADPNDTLPEITYWLMGSLSAIRMQDLLFAVIPIGIGCLILLMLRWRLNILTLGEEEARSIGVNTRILRYVVILCATLITAACVSISGMIGWVGLVIPHFARMMVGYDYRATLPVSLLLGASFMMLVDNLSRTLTTTEIPLGILTSFVGAPFFLYLLLKEGKR